MNSNANLLKTAWSDSMFKALKENKELSLPTDSFIPNFIAPGPFYYYHIDFSDFSLSNVHSGIEKILGVAPSELTLDFLLNSIHPEDIQFVKQTEEALIDLFYKTLDPMDLLTRKSQYNFRIKTANGSYKMINHQALVLSLDRNLHFLTSINIHTDISHIVQKPDYTYSIVDLQGEDHLFNLSHNATNSFTLTKRELEIIQLIANGMTSAQISENLFISAETVRRHRKNILHKSTCSNMTQVLRKCVDMGWI